LLTKYAIQVKDYKSSLIQWQQLKLREKKIELIS